MHGKISDSKAIEEVAGGVSVCEVLELWSGTLIICLFSGVLVGD